MLKQLQEDFLLLGGYFYKNLLTYYYKIEHQFVIRSNKKKLKDRKILNVLLEFEGAKTLGGEFMGKRYIENSPSLIYRIKRQSIDSSAAYYYVGYILRGENQFQVVIDENWDAFHRALHRAIQSNEKAIVGVRKREGGYVHGNAKKRFGRKKL